MPRDVVATKLGQGSQFLRHLQRLKRSDHPCIKSKRVMTVGRKRYAVASCHASIDNGCWDTILKYSTPLCVEIKRYVSEVGREFTYSCGCKPQTEILTVGNFSPQISTEPRHHQNCTQRKSRFTCTLTSLGRNIHRQTMGSRRSEIDIFDSDCESTKRRMRF